MERSLRLFQASSRTSFTACDGLINQSIYQAAVAREKVRQVNASSKTSLQALQHRVEQLQQQVQQSIRQQPRLAASLAPPPPTPPAPLAPLPPSLPPPPGMGFAPQQQLRKPPWLDGPKPDRNTECMRFFNNGRCDYGERCRWVASHVCRICNNSDHGTFQHEPRSDFKG